jgi:hypothetical protein
VFFKALRYVSYVVELLRLAVTFKGTSNDVLAAKITDVIFRAVDQGTGGLASRSIPKDKLVEAVRQVVDVIDDVV